METFLDSKGTPARVKAVAMGMWALATAAHAQSSVTIYGIVDATVRYATNAPGKGTLLSVGDGAQTGSRLGFKGEEVLQPDWKAFFILEEGLDPSTGTQQQTTASASYGQAAATTGRAWGRTSLVGLDTPAGQVSLGRQYTIAHELSSRFQPEGNPNMDALSVYSGHHVARQDNMVRYQAKLADVTVYASGTASESNGSANGVGASGKWEALEVMAYAQNMRAATGGEVRRIYGLGGVYTLPDGSKLMGGTMLRKQELGAQRNLVYSLGMVKKLSDTLNLEASYVRDRQSHTSAGARSVLSGGLDVLLSKRTDVYVLLDRNQITGAYTLPTFMGHRGEQFGVTSGLRHRF